MKSLSVSEEYGWSRYIAHQTYYSLIGRDFEWELMPLGIDQKVAAIVWSPLGWGRLTGKTPPRSTPTEVSRLHSTAEQGPPVADEYLYKVVDALDEVAKETGKSIPQIALNWLLQRPVRRKRHHRRAYRRTTPAESRGRRMESHNQSGCQIGRRQRRHTPIPILASAPVQTENPLPIDAAA